MTRLLAIDPERPAAAVLDEAVAVLRRGGVVAYLTDTVYGLAVDALRPEAIARLYAVKGRPESKALPVIIGALEQLPLVAATVPATAARLIEVFWPGALAAAAWTYPPCPPGRE
jgi:L-threonylcarbamoyladenylate synthase